MGKGAEQNFKTRSVLFAGFAFLVLILWVLWGIWIFGGHSEASELQSSFTGLEVQRSNSIS